MTSSSAEATRSGSRLVEVTPGGAVRRVAVAASVRAAGIRQVAISRDGARIAMVVGSPGRTELASAALRTCTAS